MMIATRDDREAVDESRAREEVRHPLAMEDHQVGADHPGQQGSVPGVEVLVLDAEPVHPGLHVRQVEERRDETVAIDDDPSDDARQHHQPAKDAQRPAEPHDDEDEPGQDQIELFLDRERPAPTHVLPVHRQEVVHIEEIRPHVVGVHEGRKLHEDRFARDVVHEVQPDDHRDGVDRYQTQEAPHVEAPDLKGPRLPVLAQQNRADQITADHEEEVDAHVAPAGPLRPSPGRDADRLRRERPEMKEHQVIGHHPENGDRSHAIDDRIVKGRALGQGFPIASQIEQAEIVPGPPGGRHGHR